MSHIKTSISLFVIVCFGFFSSCNKDTLHTYDVNGVAQKGPYIIGTSITISELDEKLNQTGKNFNSTIIDNKGSFNIPDFDFASSYIQLTADGNYFDELRGSETSTETAIAA